jgi:hypothetical protein
MNINTSNLDTTIEHWASIDGYLNYQVSWWGRVVNTKTGRILKAGAARGYLFVILCRNGIKKIHYIHRLVAHEWVPNPDDKRCVDHIDNDKSNNHHDNLRAASQSENCKNRSKRPNTSSIYKGVCMVKKTGRWRAHINLDGILKHLGYFTNERAAGEAYNTAALKFYKEFARINVFEN